MGESKMCRYIASAIAKHGPDNFEFSVLQECTREDLPRVEGEWIRHLGTLYPGGYNLTSFTDTGGRVVAAQTRKRMSRSLKGKSGPNLGRVFSVESREKMAAARRGCKMDEKTRLALKRSRRRKGEFTNSPEARVKISARLKELWQDPEYRRQMLLARNG